MLSETLPDIRVHSLLQRESVGEAGRDRDSAKDVSDAVQDTVHCLIFPELIPLHRPLLDGQESVYTGFIPSQNLLRCLVHRRLRDRGFRGANIRCAR